MMLIIIVESLTASLYVRHCVGVEAAQVNIASVNRESKIEDISMSGPPRICSNHREKSCDYHKSGYKFATPEQLFVGI